MLGAVELGFEALDHQSGGFGGRDQWTHTIVSWLHTVSGLTDRIRCSGGQ